MKFRMRDGTGTIDLRYVVEDYDRHGNVRVYVRRHGRKIRIRETPGTEEFMVAYRAALETHSTGESVKPTAAAPGSLRWLVQCYYGCPEFLDLHKDTRTKRRGILDAICREHSNRPATTGFISAFSQATLYNRDSRQDETERAGRKVFTA